MFLLILIVLVALTDLLVALTSDDRVTVFFHTLFFFLFGACAVDQAIKVFGA